MNKFFLIQPVPTMGANKIFLGENSFLGPNFAESVNKGLLWVKDSLAAGSIVESVGSICLIQVQIIAKLLYIVSF